MSDWEEAADVAEQWIVTDMYGSVTPLVHDFLRDHAVTPHDWEVLMEAFTRRRQSAACMWVASHSLPNGHYDSFHSERALVRQGLVR